MAPLHPLRQSAGKRIERDLLIYLKIGVTQMFNDRYEEKSYFAQGALEINIHAREQEKILARMSAELKAEEKHLPRLKTNRFIAFFNRLLASLRAPTRQLASDTQK
jgi:hypothetical protein